MRYPLFVRTSVAVVALAALAACDSAEERAQKHLERGIELIEAGDVERGLVELRNVFVLDATNTEARMIYGEAARSAGLLGESYQAYLRIVEANPNNVEARIALSEMAVEVQNWDEGERHIEALLATGTDDPRVDTLRLALGFRRAAVASDDAKIADLTREAIALYEEREDDHILHRLLIDGLVRAGDNSAALEVVDQAITVRPDDRALYIVRAGLLNLRGDPLAVEQHLRETVARFPEDSESKALLIQQLVNQGRVDDAETFLREELAAAAAPETPHVTLITFLRQVRGNEAALAELDAAIGAYEQNRLFRALKAGIVFDEGDTDDAIATMVDVLEGAEAGEETDRFKITLAKMRQTIGDREGASAIVQDVLATDAANVEALKMLARWQIDDDMPEDALRSLRAAIDRAPEDPEALMLMSDAHRRSGSPELAQDLMALAVEASGSAPREALAFARTLFQQERYRPAEDVLIRALRRSPNNVEILVLLGQIYIANQDWGRAEGVERTLRQLNTDFTDARAEELQFQIFGRREGRDRAIAYLEELIASDDASAVATVALIRERLADGRGDEALLLAEELVSDLPDNIQAKLVLGNTYIALEDFEAAETVIRTTLETSEDPSVALQLIRVLSAQARVDEARDTLDTALESAPTDRNLLWVKASFLERSNDIDGAIEIYEQLYTQDSSSLVIANNLASLLATYRQDEQSLQRAFLVGRRLKGTDVPPFQDTYGWILFRRGDVEEAVTYLEPAAEGLPNDPIVQYHLGKAYEALGRNADARAQFQRAVDIAASGDTREQLVEARAILAGEAGLSQDQ